MAGEESRVEVKSDAEYAQAWVGVSIVVCAILPIFSGVLGFAVRCFFWAAGFRDSFF